MLLKRQRKLSSVSLHLSLFQMAQWSLSDNILYTNSKTKHKELNNVQVKALFFIVFDVFSSLSFARCSVWLSALTCYHDIMILASASLLYRTC